MKLKSFYNGALLLLLLATTAVNAQYDLTDEWEKGYLKRQPPYIIMDSLGIKPGMTIGEIGAGRGRFTVYMAQQVGPSGKIYANDIDELSLSYLRGRCRRQGFSNIEIVTGMMDDPMLPEKSLDMAIMVLVYHMLENPDKLLENIKKSLKPGASLVILDPVDAEIDREFGIDRSNPDVKAPTIRERISKSAENAGYEVTGVKTFLSNDIIFILHPVIERSKVPAGQLLVSAIIQTGTVRSRLEFERIRKDNSVYDISEMEFRKAGYEFIGSKSYPEAIAVMEMGIELFPESAMLYAEMGEAFLMQGIKEKSLESFRQAARLDPDNPQGKFLLENFDAVFNQVHPEKK